MDSPRESSYASAGNSVDLSSLRPCPDLGSLLSPRYNIDSGCGSADGFSDHSGVFRHPLIQGCNIPVGWAGHLGGLTEFGSSVDLPGSESTATGFAFNIPVRACVSGLLG